MVSPKDLAFVPLGRWLSDCNPDTSDGASEGPRVPSCSHLRPHCSAASNETVRVGFLFSQKLNPSDGGGGSLCSLKERI